MAKTKKIAFLGVFTALAVILSYIEYLIPIPIPIPGVKLGLANLVIVVVLYTFGEKEALFLSIIRILIVGVLFAGISGVLFSLAGGLLSFTAMALFKKTDIFSIVGVSVIGSVFHNIGQIAIASLVVENIKLFYYLPLLIISGEITGAIIGVISYHIIVHMAKGGSI